MAAASASLHVFGTGNQLRLGYSTTLFTDINTSSAGHLIFQPGNSTGKIAFGIAAPASGVGFHSSMGVFRISDPLAANASKALQISPNFIANGEIPNGAAILSVLNTGGLANEGLSLLPTGSTTSGVKLGAYAFCSSGWKSVWETANTGNLGGLPNLLLVKTGGNVGIGTGASAPTAKLEVAGQVKITGGTPGVNKVLTSDASGLASWQPVNGLLAGGTTNYIPKWTSANALSSTSLIYDNGTYIGIGTNNPREKLEVNGNARIGADGVTEPSVDPNTALTIYQSGSGKKGLKFRTWDNSMPVIYIENTNYPNKSLFTVYGNGFTRIGEQSILPPHDNAQLAVSGKIVCQSLYVLKATSWADFVFKKKDLEKLENVEKYINENKHLPGIPSEEEVYANGYDINEMDAKLLEKIETLYLHIIALEKEIKELKNK